MTFLAKVLGIDVESWKTQITNLIIRNTQLQSRMDSLREEIHTPEFWINELRGGKISEEDGLKIIEIIKFSMVKE